MIVVAEASIAVGLLTGLGAIPASVGAIAMLVGYATLMAVDLGRGKKHECGCGRSGAEISWALVIRNGTAVLALFVAVGLSPSAGIVDRIILSMSVLALWLLRLELGAAFHVAEVMRSRG